MNYHAFSYDIAHLEHHSRARSGELHGGRRHRYQRRKPSSSGTSSNATPA